MAVIRSAGRGDVQRVRSAFGERTFSRVELNGNGVMTVLGGFLLVLPGFITDLLGLLLLLPPTQNAIRAALRRAAGRFEQQNKQQTGRPEVVDLPPDQWRRVGDERIKQQPSSGKD
jgi:UPF0716 protein FxsA